MRPQSRRPPRCGSFGVPPFLCCELYTYFPCARKLKLLSERLLTSSLGYQQIMQPMSTPTLDAKKGFKKILAFLTNNSFLIIWWLTSVWFISLIIFSYYQLLTVIIRRSFYWQKRRYWFSTSSIVKQRWDPGEWVSHVNRKNIILFLTKCLFIFDQMNPRKKQPPQCQRVWGCFLRCVHCVVTSVCNAFEFLLLFHSGIFLKSMHFELFCVLTQNRQW